MINKNKWELINNGLNDTAISFKQDIDKSGYNLIDIRKTNNKDNSQTLSLHFKKCQYISFENRKDALNFLFKEYPILKKLKGGLK
jgi:hypothetical protein